MTRLRHFNVFLIPWSRSHSKSRRIPTDAVEFGTEYGGSMANPNWQLSGDYFETCSCDYVCPCVLTNMAGRPTNGDCNFAMVFEIDRGELNNVKLDGLNFA